MLKGAALIRKILSLKSTQENGKEITEIEPVIKKEHDKSIKLCTWLYLVQFRVFWKAGKLFGSFKIKIYDQFSLSIYI